MIKVTLTSVTGSTMKIELPTKQSVLDYVEALTNNLPKGATVQVDAPLAGVSGWIRSKA